MGHRDLAGSIEAGMRADLIVTQRNPYEVPIRELHKTEVKLTIIDGETVFDAKSPPLLIENARQ